MHRRGNFLPLGWFWDLYQRRLLELDPPYQRRSVWNQEYKDYFIDTVLHGYPCPAIFLYEDISPTGVMRYSVVDGKQRLLTLFSFIKDEFPVYEKYYDRTLQGVYFSALIDVTKTTFWSYQFAVEYLPSVEHAIINDIFDRINRNVAKLTPQELRHARYSGRFISLAEDLAEWMFGQLPANIPNLASQSRRQMKDVELVEQLLLLLELGPSSFSQADLDVAFSDRDSEWISEDEVCCQFKNCVHQFRNLIVEGELGPELTRTRYRNQADFYSLFGATHQLSGHIEQITTEHLQQRLKSFINVVENEERRSGDEMAKAYYAAVRSASNDIGARKRRIDIVKDVITGVWQEHDNSTDSATTI